MTLHAQGALIRRQHGRLDAVVANAVVDDHAPLGKITEEQFDKMIGTNLKGVLFAVQSAVPLMSSGSIILIGSSASVAPPAGMSIYGAIKAAFHALCRWRINAGHVRSLHPSLRQRIPRRDLHPR